MSPALNPKDRNGSSPVPQVSLKSKESKSLKESTVLSGLVAFSPRQLSDQVRSGVEERRLRHLRRRKQCPKKG